MGSSKSSQGSNLAQETAIPNPLERYDEIEATWEPLDALEGASTALRTYWFETYNETIPFHAPWTYNEVWSA